MEYSVSRMLRTIDLEPSDAYGENEPAVVSPNKVLILSAFAGEIGGNDASLTNGVKSRHLSGRAVLSIVGYMLLLVSKLALLSL